MKRVQACGLWTVAAVLLVCPSLSRAAGSDYYLDFLYAKGYVKEEYLRIEGQVQQCYKPLAAALKPQDEAAWREATAQAAALAVTSGGGPTIVAWSEGGARIYLQALERDGRRSWGPIAVNATISRQEGYKLAADGAGGAFLVWQETRYDCESVKEGRTLVIAQRFDAQGRPRWGDKGVLIARGGLSGRGPDLVADGRGGAFVIWHQLRSWSGHVAMFMQRLDETGKKLWPAEGIELRFSPHLPQLYGGVVAPDSEGGAIVVATGTKKWKDAAMQRITAEGKPLWSQPLGISEGNTNLPDPVALPEGKSGAFIALISDRPHRAYDLLLVRPAEGKAPGAAIATVREGEQISDARLVPDGRGGAFVMWSSRERSDALMVKQSRLWDTPAVAIGRPGKLAGSAQAVSDGRGGMFAAWMDIATLRAEGWSSGTKVSVRDVYLQRLDENGALPWGAPRRIASNVGKNGGYPSLALTPDGEGGIVVVWADGRRALEAAPPAPADMDVEYHDPQTEGARLYAQRIDASGKTLWQDGGIDISASGDTGARCYEGKANTAVVAGFDINLRAQPAVAATALAKLDRGASVTVVERRPACIEIAGRRGQWVRVRAPATTKEGWLFDAYLLYPHHADLLGP